MLYLIGPPGATLNWPPEASFNARSASGARGIRLVGLRCENELSPSDDRVTGWYDLLDQVE